MTIVCSMNFGRLAVQLNPTQPLDNVWFCSEQDRYGRRGYTPTQKYAGPARGTPERLQRYALFRIQILILMASEQCFLFIDLAPPTCLRLEKPPDALEMLRIIHAGRPVMFPGGLSLEQMRVLS